MDYKFFLDEIEIDEPIGWQDFELSLKRDPKTHGIQFEASTGSLKFYGTDAQYLIDKKNTYGIQANVVFTAQEFCNDPYTPFEEIVGRLNFGRFRSTCGTQCIVEIPLEEEGCKVIFKNRYDQKVDLDSLVASDEMTPLPSYGGIGLRLDMPSKSLQASVDGSVSADDNVVEFQETIGTGDGNVIVRANYATERYNNIQTGQLVAVGNWDSDQSPDFPISPQLLLEDVITCFEGVFDIESNYKGSIALTHVGGVDSAEVEFVKHQIISWDATGDITADGVVLAEETLFDGSETALPFNLDFDSNLSINTAVAEGVGIYAVMRIVFAEGLGDQVNFVFTFDSATYFTLNAVRRCPETEADAYLVHETLSRISENITNGCIRVKSAYYGRTDSQPYSFDADGCGGLRMLTSGLKIRNAPNGKFFASMKDIFEGLNPIDNIGFDLINDPEVPGHYIMRVEDVDYFYQDEEIFIIDNIPQGSGEVQEQMHYAKVSVGYEKWEVEGINGLDEFNSNREYRTSLDTVSNPLEIKSKLIAGSYAYEVTRQQNFADSGAADTKFDNDIFILTLLRNAYDFEVEQGNVTDASNFFDPATILNARLSPLRNLMRWYKTIAPG